MYNICTYVYRYTYRINIYGRELPEEQRMGHAPEVQPEEGSCAEIPERACESQQAAEIVYTVSFCFTYALKLYAIILKFHL